MASVFVANTDAKMIDKAETRLPYSYVQAL